MVDHRRYNLGLAPDFQQVAADIAAADTVVADTVAVDIAAVAAGFRRRYTMR